MRDRSSMKCRRCGEDMKLVAAIEPLAPERPGVIAFLCQSCGEAKSELIEFEAPPDDTPAAEQ